MTYKRVYILFSVFALFANVLMIRLFFLVTNETYAASAAGQSVYTSTVATVRPDFYDCNGLPLTGETTKLYAVVTPSELSKKLVSKYVETASLEYFEQAITGTVPFIVPVSERVPENALVQNITLPSRYFDGSLANHLIGYLDYEGKGVSGLESVFDDYLKENSAKTTLSVGVNANREIIESSKAEVVVGDAYDERIVLTIDKSIQAQVEKIADESFKRGAVVVLECGTGEVKAMVSRPDFSPNNVGEAINRNDSALINRALTPYNLGSVYKIVVAAAALEAGLDEFCYECEGSIEIDGKQYSCNNGKQHGEQGLKEALTNSCNTYFIALGQRLGGAAIYNTANRLGLGRKIELCEGFMTSAGNMPSETILSGSNDELINHCFGQGKLLASPFAVALYTSCIANGGEFIKPSLVKSFGDEKCEITSAERVLQKETAQRIAECMRSVIDEGTGVNGKPELCDAAGKTGTAQTGRYNADGSEEIIGWFSGFFPADKPKYVVAVMVENEGYGYETAAPVFKKIADSLTLYAQ